MFIPIYLLYFLLLRVVALHFPFIEEKEEEEEEEKDDVDEDVMAHVMLGGSTRSGQHASRIPFLCLRISPLLYLYSTQGSCGLMVYTYTYIISQVLMHTYVLSLHAVLYIDMYTCIYMRRIE